MMTLIAGTGRRGGLGTEYYVGRVTRLFILLSFGDGADPLLLYYWSFWDWVDTAKHIVGARAHHKGGICLNPWVVLLYPLLLPTLFFTNGVYEVYKPFYHNILLLVGAEGG
jgi:hypothetical protein